MKEKEEETFSAGSELRRTADELLIVQHAIGAGTPRCKG